VSAELVQAFDRKTLRDERKFKFDRVALSKFGPAAAVKYFRDFNGKKMLHITAPYV
jgi:hypothetical protein